MVCAGDAVNPSSSSRSNSDLEIGCLIDLATGLVTFMANGKELSTVYQVKENGARFEVPSVFCTKISDKNLLSILPSHRCPVDHTDLTGHQNKTTISFYLPSFFFCLSLSTLDSVVNFSFFLN